MQPGTLFFHRQEASINSPYEEMAKLGGDCLLLFLEQGRSVFHLTLSVIRIECLRTFLSSEAQCQENSEQWPSFWEFLLAQWA